MSLSCIKERKQTIIRDYLKACDVTGAIQVLTTLVPMGLLWVAAYLGLGVSLWITAAATVLLTMFTIRALVLMHECGHGSLFHTQRLNRACGFIFGVISGMPQYVWSQNHNFHHATNGNWQQYRGPLTTQSTNEYEAMSESRQRIYRGFRNIAVAPLGGFLYLLFNPRFNWIRGSLALLLHVIREKIRQPELSFKAHAATFRTRLWKSPREYRHMTWNNLALCALGVFMCWCVGPALFFAVFITSVSLAGAVGIVLFTVQHNFEHSHATDDKAWDYDVGAMHGTSFLILPGWLNWFTANIAYHHIHHLSARIPNYRLAACHEAHRELFTEVRRVKLSEIHRALKCILWDRQAQRIISIAEYQRQLQTGWSVARAGQDGAQ